MDNVIIVSDDDEDGAEEVVNGDSDSESEETDFMIANGDRSSESELEETTLVNSIEENRDSVSFLIVNDVFQDVFSTWLHARCQGVVLID